MLLIFTNFLAFILAVIGLYLIFHKKKVRFPFVLLSVWILVSMIFLPVPILSEFNLWLSYPHFFRVSAPFLYLMGPLIYIFTRAALNDEKKFYKTDFLHVLPFLLHFIELMPFYFSSTSVKQALIQQIDWQNLSILLKGNEGLLDAKIHSMLKSISSIVYILLSIRILYRYLKLQKIRTNNFLGLVLFIVISRFIQLSFLSIYAIFQKFNWGNYLVNLPNSFSIIFVVIILLNKTIKLSGLDDIEFSNQFISLDKLEIREKKLKLIAMDLTSDDLIIFLSPNFEILHFNKAQEDFVYLVLNKKIRIGSDFKALFNTPDFDFILKPIEQILLDKRPFDVEHEMITSKGGHKDWVNIRLLPIFDDESKFIGITALTKNISQKKEIETKYLNQIKSLENIAWRHSHEMRAPLSNILGLAKQLKKSKHLFNENDADLLRYLETEAEKLDKIIKANLQQTSFKN